jgi:paraquat-inducible protein B
MDLDAHAVEDFAVLDADLVFPNGSTAGDKLKVNVKVIDDQLVERDEQFWVEIASEDEHVQFATKSARITIIDNDGKCS